jgi:hypothetical protein
MWWIIGGMALLGLAAAVWTYAPDDRGDSLRLTELLADRRI